MGKYSLGLFLLISLFLFIPVIALDLEPKEVDSNVITFIENVSVKLPEPIVSGGSGLIITPIIEDTCRISKEGWEQNVNITQCLCVGRDEKGMCNDWNNTIQIEETEWLKTMKETGDLTVFRRIADEIREAFKEFIEYVNNVWTELIECSECTEYYTPVNGGKKLEPIDLEPVCTKWNNYTLEVEHDNWTEVYDYPYDFIGEELFTIVHDKDFETKSEPITLDGVEKIISVDKIVELDNSSYDSINYQISGKSASLKLGVNSTIVVSESGQDYYVDTGVARFKIDNATVMGSFQVQFWDADTGDWGTSFVNTLGECYRGGIGGGIGWCYLCDVSYQQNQANVTFNVSNCAWDDYEIITFFNNSNKIRVDYHIPSAVTQIGLLGRDRGLSQDSVMAILPNGTVHNCSQGTPNYAFNSIHQDMAGNTNYFSSYSATQNFTSVYTFVNSTIFDEYGVNGDLNLKGAPIQYNTQEQYLFIDNMNLGGAEHVFTYYVTFLSGDTLTGGGTSTAPYFLDDSNSSTWLDYTSTASFAGMFSNASLQYYDFAESWGGSQVTYSFFNNGTYTNNYAIVWSPVMTVFPSWSFNYSITPNMNVTGSDCVGEICNANWAFLINTTFTNDSAPNTATASESSTEASPTNVGSGVSFSATATDPDSQQYSLLICSSDAQSLGSCTATTFCESSLTNSGSQASCSYTTLQGDSTTNLWYGFACDTMNACTGLTESDGTFHVNHAPTTATASETSTEASPTNVGDGVSFSATVTDSDSDTYVLYICKGNGISGTTCTTGEWCHSTATASSVQASCSYTTLQGDSTTNLWYGFAVDVHNLNVGLTESDGTFHVNHAPTITTNTPASQTNLNNDITTTYNVEWTASDSDSDTLTISCYGDSDSSGYDKTYTCFEDTADDSIESCTISSWDDGDWYVWCNSTDPTNMWGTDYSTSFLRLDTTAPTLETIFPINDAEYAFAPNITGTCTDAGVGIDKIWSNNTDYATIDGASPFNVTNTSALTEGLYNLLISCNDTLNNIATTTLNFYHHIKPIIYNDTYVSENVTFMPFAFEEDSVGELHTYFYVRDYNDVDFTTCDIKYRNKDHKDGNTDWIIVNGTISTLLGTDGWLDRTCNFFGDNVDNTTISFWTMSNDTRTYKPSTSNVYEKDWSNDNNITVWNNYLIGTNITNVSVKPTTTYALKFKQFVQPLNNRDMIIHMCNSSYVQSGGGITSSSFCTPIGVSQKGDTEEEPYYHFATNGDSIFGGVKISSDLQFWFETSAPLEKFGWNLSLSDTTDIDQTFYSTDDGDTWTNYVTKDLNAMLYQITFGDDTHFEANVSICDVLSNCNSTVFEQDWSDVNHAPGISILQDELTGGLLTSYVGTNITERGSVWINATVLDPDENPVNCSFYVLNNDTTLHSTLETDVAPDNVYYGTCSNLWDTTSLSDGDYRIEVNVIDATLTTNDTTNFIRLMNTPPVFDSNATFTFDYLGNTSQTGSVSIDIVNHSATYPVDESWLETDTTNYSSTNDAGTFTYDISQATTIDGWIKVNDSIGNEASYGINFTLTNNSYVQNDSTELMGFGYQVIKKVDNFYNYNDSNSYAYSIKHANVTGFHTISAGGSFSGSLEPETNDAIRSEWDNAWLTSTWSDWEQNSTTASTESVQYIKRYVNVTNDLDIEVDFVLNWSTTVPGIAWGDCDTCSGEVTVLSTGYEDYVAFDTADIIQEQQWYWVQNVSKQSTLDVAYANSSINITRDDNSGDFSFENLYWVATECPSPISGDAIIDYWNITSPYSVLNYYTCEGTVITDSTLEAWAQNGTQTLDAQNLTTIVEFTNELNLTWQDIEITTTDPCSTLNPSSETHYYNFTSDEVKVVVFNKSGDAIQNWTVIDWVQNQTGNDTLDWQNLYKTLGANNTCSWSWTDINWNTATACGFTGENPAISLTGDETNHYWNASITGDAIDNDTSTDWYQDFSVSNNLSHQKFIRTMNGNNTCSIALSNLDWVTDGFESCTDYTLSTSGSLSFTASESDKYWNATVSGDSITDTWGGWGQNTSISSTLSTQYVKNTLQAEYTCDYKNLTNIEWVSSDPSSYFTCYLCSGTISNINYGENSTLNALGSGDALLESNNGAYDWEQNTSATSTWDTQYINRTITVLEQSAYSFTGVTMPIIPPTNFTCYSCSATADFPASTSTNVNQLASGDAITNVTSDWAQATAYTTESGGSSYIYKYDNLTDNSPWMDFVNVQYSTVCRSGWNDTSVAGVFNIESLQTISENTSICNANNTITESEYGYINVTDWHSYVGSNLTGFRYLKIINTDPLVSFYTNIVGTEYSQLNGWSNSTTWDWSESISAGETIYRKLNLTGDGVTEINSTSPEMVPYQNYVNVRFDQAINIPNSTSEWIQNCSVIDIISIGASNMPYFFVRGSNTTTSVDSLLTGFDVDYGTSLVIINVSKTFNGSYSLVKGNHSVSIVYQVLQYLTTPLAIKLTTLSPIGTETAEAIATPGITNIIALFGMVSMGIIFNFEYQNKKKLKKKN